MAASETRYPVPGTCPVCGDELTVTRLQCGRCRTTLEGLFNLGRFYYLNREQQQFIAVFVKCRGKIKDVEEELGISYPTVVSRLDEVIAALTDDLQAAPAAPLEARTLAAMDSEGQALILDELAAGHLTSAEALALLQGKDLPQQENKEN